MVTLLVNITTSNTGGQKSVSVFALNDANPAAHIAITFSVLAETHVVNESFQANEGKTISCNHTATGKGLVRATAGPAMDQRFCDVDATTCYGLGAGAIIAALQNH